MLKAIFASVMATATREHTVIYFYNCPIAGPFFNYCGGKRKKRVN